MASEKTEAEESGEIFSESENGDTELNQSEQTNDGKVTTASDFDKNE